MFANLINKLWPRICQDEYRSHCYHWLRREKRIKPESPCIHPTSVERYECCRCGMERLLWWGNDGGWE